MAIISRGFSGRRSPADAKLPPGQYLTTDFPVLSAGPTPHISLDRWEFTIDDGSNVLKRWDWKSFRGLPTETITVDLHCVTHWSKFGTSWEGVSLDVLLAGIRTDLDYAMFRSYGDYTTNLPLKDVMNNQAWIAFQYDGADLASEHGGTRTSDVAYRNGGWDARRNSNRANDHACSSRLAGSRRRPTR